MLLAPWVEDDCLIVWLAELCADCCFPSADVPYRLRSALEASSGVETRGLFDSVNNRLQQFDEMWDIDGDGAIELVGVDGVIFMDDDVA